MPDPLFNAPRSNAETAGVPHETTPAQQTTLIHKASNIDLTKLRDRLVELRTICDKALNGEIGGFVEFASAVQPLRDEKDKALKNFGLWIGHTRGTADYALREAKVTPVFRALRTLERAMWPVWDALPGSPKMHPGDKERLPIVVARYRMVAGICLARLAKLGSE
jgi:hypothetical protein